ncbi:MAG: acyltransferase family protein, partial [Ketobacter sp.]
MVYRKDIDGLRSVAVLLVLLFHCQFTGFDGGYVGVDVFFVISGFLITGIILEDLKAGRFNFRSFYVRRTRRLLPALAVTILVTLVGSALIMTPEHLKETASSAIFTSLSLANVYFAGADSYFGAASEIKPLLHTWSLGVEEQFYVFWPLTLVLIYRFAGIKAVLLTTLLGFFLGLGLSEYWIDYNSKQAYFLPMFRVYQFLAGAALVFIPHLRLRGWLEDVGLALGLAIVIGSALLFDKDTPFPGLYGMVPTIGALLILQCGQANVVGKLLTVKPMVWMGHVSYSAYLAHWPVIVFWRYLSADPFTFIEKCILLALSIGFGALMYYKVETPFRLNRQAAKNISWKQTFPPLSALTILVIISVGLKLTDGLPQRMELAPEHQAYATASKFQFLQDYSNGILDLGTSQSDERILIFGDSMMQNYIPALMQIPRFEQAAVKVITRGGCVMANAAVHINSHSPDLDCVNYRKAVEELSEHYDIVVWAQKWGGYGSNLHWQLGDDYQKVFANEQPNFSGWQSGLIRTLDHLESISDRVVLFGPQYEAESVPHILERIGPMAP